MASRFVVADNDVIEELKSTNLLVGVFKKLAGRAALRNIGDIRGRHGDIRGSKT